MAIWTNAGVNWNVNTVTAFRAALRLVGESLLACGFIRTADTGQINWDTVPLPTTNGVAGYEIFRFNDAMQATVPVFFKIEYGIGGLSSQPAIYFTFGSGTDGAGNLTGRVGPRIVRGLSGAPASAVVPSRASGDGSYWTASFGESSINSVPLYTFALERARNADGTLSNAGVAFLYRPGNAKGTGSGSAWTMTYTFNSSGTVHPSAGFGLEFVLVPHALTSLIQPNGDVGLYPAIGFMPAVRPLTCAVGYIDADLPQYTTFTAPVLGAPRTYFTTGNASITNNGQVVTSIALRYE